MPLQADQDLDLITVTLRDLGEHKWTDIVSPLQRHIFINRLLKKHKVGFHAGYGIQYNLQVNPTNSAKMTGLYATDKTQQVDLMTTGNVPFRHGQTWWVIDAHEISMNREPRRIVDIVQEKRAGAMISLAELIETQGWSLPGGSTDNLNSFGLQYWIVPNTTQGFNGGNPYGYSAGAGSISSTQFPNYSNYTDTYSDMTKLDLVRAMRRMAYYVDFQSPSNADIPAYNTGDANEYFTTLLVLNRLEEIAEQQNDNLGNDLVAKNGQAVFRRNAITWVPKFDQGGLMSSSAFSNSAYTAGTTTAPKNPVYAVNWGVFKVFFLEGWYMKQTGPYRKEGIQHNVIETFLDLSFNFLCYDRRRCGVLTQ